MSLDRLDVAPCEAGDVAPANGSRAGTLGSACDEPHAFVLRLDPAFWPGGGDVLLCGEHRIQADAVGGIRWEVDVEGDMPYSTQRGEWSR